jgi:hypothetical protein
VSKLKGAIPGAKAASFLPVQGPDASAVHLPRPGYLLLLEEVTMAAAASRPG